MTVEDLECISGASVYFPDFAAALRSQFPHHGRTRFLDDDGYLYARRIRAHVCPLCTKAYDEWQFQRQSDSNGRTSHPRRTPTPRRR